MEIIRKRINLNSHISRHGSLIPYLTGDVSPQGEITMDKYAVDASSYSENGNWGAFPYDIDIAKCRSFVAFNGREIKPSSLIKFFSGNRISFDELSSLYFFTKNAFNKIHFHKRILKKNELLWVDYTPSFYEKFNIVSLFDLPEDAGDGTVIGIFKNPDFTDFEIADLYIFLMKAMGIFTVNDAYIRNDNGVPEIMYYTGIKGYLNTMDSFKDSNVCCNLKEYEFLGGNIFYNYLKRKQEEIEDEIKYWHFALFRDETYEIDTPFINIPVALNCDSNIIGLYTAVPNTTENTENDDEGSIIETSMISPLKYLRRSKITYCTEWKNGVASTVELPLILDEKTIDKNNVVLEYVLTQPYQVGFVKNISKGDFGRLYGDIIYRMDFLKEYSYNSQSFSETTIYEADGETIKSGHGYQSIGDYVDRTGIDEGYKTIYNNKTQGTSAEEFDVWDNPDKAKADGLNEFSNKTTVGSKIPQYEITYDENGNEIKTITGYTQTFKTTLYDFKESTGVVNIYYVLGGRLKEDNGVLSYYDAHDINEKMPSFNDFIKNPNIVNNWTVDKYLYIKNELSKKENYPEKGGVKFKGEYVNAMPVRTEDNRDEIWVYEVMENDGTLIKGDYVISISDTKRFNFTSSIINDYNFTGVRLFEQKKWRQYNYKNSPYEINILHDEYSQPTNIFNINGLVSNVENVELVDYSSMNEIIPCVLFSHGSNNTDNNSSIIALDQDFGKIETIVENINDVSIDRGYVTSFELYYKLGEINTMEDMENYGNNFFGL